MVTPRPRRARIDRQRLELLQQLEDLLDGPMVVLGFVWLALIALELTTGLPPSLEVLSTVIWIIFIVDFAVRFTLAPRRLEYLRGNWLTALALALPALRVLRVARLWRLVRIGRVARGLRLARVVTSMNRGMRALRATMSRRGAGYVSVLTLLVVVVGAAGMYAFERPEEGGGLASYGDALWWTAMLLTTTGSEYWPRTAAGRILCLILAVYAFAVFGYIAATLTSFFVDRDASSGDAAVAGSAELRAMRDELRDLRNRLERPTRERT